MERDPGNVPVYDVDVTDLVRGDGETKGKSRVRAQTISIKRLSKREMERGRELWPPSINEAHERPRTRADCLPGGCNEERPCVYVSCKHNLYLDVNDRTGSIKLNFPDRDVDEIPETCSLDVAARGGVTLEEIAEFEGKTRERIRQVEYKGLAKLRDLAALDNPDDYLGDDR